MSVSTSVLMYVNMVCFVVFRKNKMFFVLLIKKIAQILKKCAYLEGWRLSVFCVEFQ